MNSDDMNFPRVVETLAENYCPTQRDWLNVFSLAVANADSVDALIYMRSIVDNAIQYEQEDVS